MQEKGEMNLLPFKYHESSALQKSLPLNADSVSLYTKTETDQQTFTQTENNSIRRWEWCCLMVAWKINENLKKYQMTYNLLKCVMSLVINNINCSNWFKLKKRQNFSNWSVV